MKAKVEPIHAPDPENRDRFAVLRVVRSRYFHCLKRARRIQAAERNEYNSGQKSRGCTAYLDSGLTLQFWNRNQQEACLIADRLELSIVQ